MPTREQQAAEAGVVPHQTPRFKILFQPSPGTVMEKPDARYPDGRALDGAHGKEPSCLAILHYPAPGVGAYMIGCKVCGKRMTVTTAGRADDARSVRIPCAPLGRG